MHGKFLSFSNEGVRHSGGERFEVLSAGIKCFNPNFALPTAGENLLSAADGGVNVFKIECSHYGN